MPLTILEVLATSDPSFVQSRIEKTAERMDLLSPSEGWIVHFTREDNYRPLWEFDSPNKGVNVVHFSHDSELTRYRCRRVGRTPMMLE
jgi:hypothetical protein